jgi:hypothetical protein
MEDQAVATLPARMVIPGMLASQNLLAQGFAPAGSDLWHSRKTGGEGG